MTNGHYVSKEACPNCRRLGNDNSGDNLIVFSNGSKHCFACGHHVSPTGYEYITNRLKTRGNEQLCTKPTVSLPPDVDFNLPEIARQWLKSYELTNTDIAKHRLMWSEYWQRLIFPYFGNDDLLAWQGRYFGNDGKAKWFSQGQLHEFIHMVGNSITGVCVLVEDIVSAIKLGNCSVCAIPLFGSYLSTKQLLRIKRYYGTIIVWLDKDKQKEAVKFSNLARSMNCNSYTIITDKDPKEIPYEELKQLLTKVI